MRPGFTLLSAKFFDYRFDKLLPIAMVFEIIHMATLVHDDVVDAALIRRGCPTLVADWGNTVSVATGDYLLAKALGILAKLDNDDVSRIIAKVCLEMCRGEIQQIDDSFNIGQSFKQYYIRIQKKTALLIKLCCQLGAMVSRANSRQIRIISTYGHCIGIAFQIVDDILDIIGDPKLMGKPKGGDIRHGIITLPMIFALRDSPGSARLRELLANKLKSEQEVQETAHLIIESGGIEKSRNIVGLYIEKARRNLRELPDIPARDALLELAKFIGEWSY